MQPSRARPCPLSTPPCRSMHRSQCASRNRLPPPNTTSSSRSSSTAPHPTSRTCSRRRAVPPRPTGAISQSRRGATRSRARIHDPFMTIPMVRICCSFSSLSRANRTLHHHHLLTSTGTKRRLISKGVSVPNRTIVHDLQFSFFAFAVEDIGSDFVI